MNWVYIIKFMSIILSVALADICWVFYFIKIEERKAMAASIWSAVIVALGAFSVENYVADNTFVFAAIIGAFIGTYISIKFKKKKDERNNI